MRQGANIRQEELGGSRGAGGSVQTLAGWRRVLHVIGDGRGRLHGALDTFDYSQEGLPCFTANTFLKARKRCLKKKQRKKMSEQENLATFKREATQYHNQNVFVHNLTQQ